MIRVLRRNFCAPCAHVCSHLAPRDEASSRGARRLLWLRIRRVRLLWTLVPLLLLGILADAAPAQLPFPVPEFTDHEIPDTQNPVPGSDLSEYLDAAALLVGLSLASFFALVTRWRRGLFLLAIASLAWLGFWREGCICPIGAIQNVTLAVFDPGYAIPTVGMVFFTAPLVFTLFFGRTFCAAVCPLGAVQELVAVRPVRVPAWLEHTLGLLAYVYLGAAVVFAATGAAFVICRYDPFVALFRLSGSANMLIFGGCFLLVGLFVGRPYCRFFCPYGAILGLLSKVSKWHVRIPPEECIKCRLCEDACPYGAIREPTVDQAVGQRRRGRRRLAGLLVLLPVLVALGTWVGSLLEVPLSRLHPTVRLAERIKWEERIEQQVQTRLEQRMSGKPPSEKRKLEKQIRQEVLQEHGQTEATTDASDAFRESGEPVGKLYRAAFEQTERFGLAGACLGAWVGLVIGAKLIHLSVRRRRTDYQPDRTGCVACGRCFWYCPNEQARLGMIENVTAEDRVPS